MAKRAGDIIIPCRDRGSGGRARKLHRTAPRSIVVDTLESCCLLACFCTMKACACRRQHRTHCARTRDQLLLLLLPTISAVALPGRLSILSFYQSSTYSTNIIDIVMITFWC